MAGSKIFGLQLDKIINDAIVSAGNLIDATLIKVVVGARTGGNLAGGKAAVETSYAAKGIISSYQDNQIDGTIIKKGDRRVLLMGRSIASDQVPEPNDKVTIEGRTYQIVAVDSDPARATYTCQAR
jgi:hypothetical protein